MENNTLYRKIVKPAHESEDGETPSVVWVTAESFGFVVWYRSYDTNDTMLLWFHYRETAIEYAVDMARLELQTLEEKSEDGMQGLSRLL